MSASKNRNYIIAVALDMELKGFKDYAPLIYTGVGKINAAIRLYEAILQYRPHLVINYGTAGALNGHNGLIKVDTFIQRDMDARPLGFARGVTPFSEKELPPTKGIVLGSGDCFVTDSATQLDGLDTALDLVDMEAFALHSVCRHLQVEFDCYKYVSDSADTSASDDWQEKVHQGAGMFREMLIREYGKSSIDDA